LELNTVSSVAAITGAAAIAAAVIVAITVINFFISSLLENKLKNIRCV
jgi:peptidoglycan biosynthesis protein MviN/MurJ (putative lipid II flippase)